MTIFYVITRFAEFGGAQIHVRELAAHMNRLGHRSVIITGMTGRIAESAVAAGIEVIRCPFMVREVSAWRDALATIWLIGLLVRRKPQLVSLHSSKAGIIGRIAARLTGTPAVFTAHGWAFTEGVQERNRKVYLAAERLMAPLADAIITVSEYDKELGLSCGVGRSEQTFSIHNGLSDIVLPPRMSRKPNEPLRIVMVARFTEQKNHHLLLSALSQIRDKSWRLSLVGDGNEEPTRCEAKLLGLDDKVDFLGEREDITCILAKSDLLCLISKWEGFPLAIVEAMRSELPVVVTNTGGCAEAIQDGINGFVVDPKSSVEIAEAICRFINDPYLAERMGQAGRARYESLLGFDEMAQRTHDVYSRVLGKPGAKVSSP